MKSCLFFLILFFSSLPVFSQEISPVCSPYKSDCINCPDHQTLFPINTLDQSSTSLDIEANNSEIQGTDTYLFTGDVELKTNTHYLAADEIKVVQSSEMTTAKGNVEFQDESFIIKSSELSVTRDNGLIIATTINANYQNTDSGTLSPNGYASEITKKGPNVNLKNTTYTLCPLNQKDWYLEADEINLDQNRNRGVADNATLKFFGLPIFYLPKYGWVLKGRGSGFLTPSYDSYTESDSFDKDGKLVSYGRSQRFRVPYYFNIAPDRDLIAAMSYMSSRGFIYEGKYRQIIKPKISPEKKHSSFELESKYLIEDKITGKNRWLLNSSLEIDLTEKINLKAKYNRISDSDFFKDIERNNPQDSTLKSNIKLSYIDKEKSLITSILTENEQTVTATPEYQKALDLNLEKTFKVIQETPIKLDLSSTKFTHEDSTNASGVRTFGSIGISKTLSKDFPVINTNADVNKTYYKLNNSSNISRQTAGVGISFAFPIELGDGTYVSEFNHLITPSVSYNYRQKVLQGNIPIFDTTDKYDEIITFSSLTSGERYTGLDRVTNANDITLAITTSSSNNKLKFTTQTAQTFYADDEVVSNTGTTNYETRKSYSDLVTSIKLHVGDRFNASNDTQYNTDKNKIVKKKNALSYSITPKKFISVALSDEGTKETAQVYGSFPITKSVHFFGGLDRITSSGITNKETTGLAYESCCWSARIAHFKEGGGSKDYSYSTGLEFVFTGLGSTASPLKKRIESNIPKYNAQLR